eukprot:8030126-Ditylum_brightwellii.AAC.1
MGARAGFHLIVFCFTKLRTKLQFWPLPRQTAPVCPWGGDHLEYGLIGANHGIFQHTGLLRCVEQVLVDGVICLGFVIYGNDVLGAVCKQ